MSSPYQIYIRQVGRKLRCSKKEKARLLRVLESEMTEEDHDPTALSTEELVRRFGPAEDAASQLQTALPPETGERYTVQRKKRFAAAIAACVCVIALLVGYLAWLGSRDIYVPPAEETIKVENRYVVEE